MSSQSNLASLLHVTTDTDRETKHVSLVCFVPNYCYNFKIFLGSVFSFLSFILITIFDPLLGLQKYNSLPRPYTLLNRKNLVRAIPPPKKKDCQNKLQLSESSKQATEAGG